MVSTLGPDRIGHGILAAQDEKLMNQISEAEIVLEICPTSNLLTSAAGRRSGARYLPRVLRARRPVHDRHRRPEMMRTHLRDEFELLLRIGAVDEAQLGEANSLGHEASFVESPSTLQTA